MSGKASTFDTRRFKQLEREGYNLIASRYDDGAQGRHALNQAVLRAAHLASGQALLDVASGPGLLARGAAKEIAPGLAVATDLADAQLAEGQFRTRAAQESNVLFAAADAESLPFPDARFDRVLCSLGLMFFPDSARALSEMRRVLKRSGRAVVSVWSSEERTPLVACALRCMRRILPPPKVERPSVFRFGDPRMLASVLREAGFGAVTVEPCVLTQRFASPAGYWQAFLDLAGGAAASLSRLPASTQAALAEEVAVELAPFRQGAGYLLQSETQVAAGHN